MGGRTRAKEPLDLWYRVPPRNSKRTSRPQYHWIVPAHARYSARWATPRNIARNFWCRDARAHLPFAIFCAGAEHGESGSGTDCAYISRTSSAVSRFALSSEQLLHATLFFFLGTWNATGTFAVLNRQSFFFDACCSGLVSACVCCFLFAIPAFCVTPSRLHRDAHAGVFGAVSFRCTGGQFHRAGFYDLAATRVSR